MTSPTAPSPSSAAVFVVAIEGAAASVGTRTTPLLPVTMAFAGVSPSAKASLST